MSSTRRFALTFLPAVSLLLLGSWLAAAPAAAQLSLPTDVDPSCTVSSTDFAGWFVGGSPGLNTPVTPADSVDFPTNNTVCDFYRWGSRMFLWLTSPLLNGGTTLESTAFYNVLPAVNGQRKLQQNGETMSFALRDAKFDEIGEVGQAGGGGVLLSQQNSLVYYGIHINQIYALFNAGQTSRQIPATDFPRNQTDLDAVATYASTAFPGTQLQDEDTLVMELKTSWVDAASVPDATKFVTLKAEVPKYDKTSTTTWTQNGTETRLLALVGMHVVGTVQNHPEFVWMTFEHISNAPDADYYYYNTANTPTKQSYDASGKFLFMATGGSQSGANTECMTFSSSSGDIQAVMNGSSPVCSGGIVPSNTYRSYPWGSTANSQAAAIVTNNTELLSINQSVRSQLVNGDVRSNYLLTGGIWTSAPSATSDAPIPDQTGYQTSDLRGSLFAANATMETYHQDLNCFDCHFLSSTATNSFEAFGLSHIYSELVPLTPPSPASSEKSSGN